MWQKLVPLLRPHFQLILVELPGVGASDEIISDKPYYEFCAEELEELRVALRIERWAILAYSTGTRVCEAYMQRYSLRVTRSVFLCPLYLHRPWMMALQIEEWIDAKQSTLANWILSGWRLHGMLLALGFNWHHYACARAWMRELKLQPVGNLKRMLLELPGKGRAPFVLPSSPPVPTLFIWGRSDVLTVRPRHPSTHDVRIWANHGAPLLVPGKIARIVLPFLKEDIDLSHLLAVRESRTRSLFKLSRYGRVPREAPERLPA